MKPAHERASTHSTEIVLETFRAVEDRCHVSDLHATILSLMGLDHTRLTYFYAGMNTRLTGVRGNVVSKVLG